MKKPALKGFGEYYSPLGVTKNPKMGKPFSSKYIVPFTVLFF
jgi:hypothetical protein